MQMLRISVLAVVVLLASCASSSPESREVWVVRHAEKLGGDDPALTPAGEERARALRDIDGIERVTRIFSTDTTRTRTTAQPLAQKLNLPVEIYDHREPGALAERVLASGESVLIVGHSNTIREIAEEFGVAGGAEVRDDEYDRIYRITIDGSQRHVEIGRYGKDE